LIDNSIQKVKNPRNVYDKYTPEDCRLQIFQF